MKKKGLTIKIGLEECSEEDEESYQLTFFEQPNPVSDLSFWFLEGDDNLREICAPFSVCKETVEKRDVDCEFEVLA